MRLVTVLALCALAACASPNPSGQDALERGDYAEAIDVLSREILVNPDDAGAHRNLGIAYLQTRNTSGAVAQFEAARGLSPEDPATLFYLGAAREKQGDLAAAQEAYQAFIDTGADTPFNDDVIRRLRWLARRKAQESARRTLAAEDSLQTNPDYEPKTLAVTHFAAVGNDPAIAPLSAALGDWLVADLSKAESSGLILVERLRLDALLREIELGQTEWVDADTAPRVGRLLSAEKILSGSLVDAGDDKVQGDLLLTEAATGKGSEAGSAQNTVDEFIELEKTLLFATIKELGLVLTPHERSLVEQSPTQDLRAIQAYGAGLLAERRGDYDEARAGYRKALEYDAGYAAPRFALESLVTDPGDLDALIARSLDEFLPGAHGSLHDRLTNTGTMISGDFWPESPSDVRPTPFPTTIPPPPEREP